jgi:hypothetical protein
LFEVLSHRLLVAKIVMLLHRAVEHPLLRRAPYLLHLQRLQVAQPILERSSVDQYRFRTGPSRKPIMAYIADRR